MRNRIRRTTAALLLLCGIPLCAQESVEWKSAGPSNISNYYISQIDFVNAEKGFLFSYPLTDYKTTTVFRTTNGGGSWENTELPQFSHTDGLFTSASNGFVVGQDVSCECGAIARSTDGGQNWTTRTFPGQKGLKGVSFPDAMNGFAASNSGAVLKTTDGGETWREIPIPGTSNYRFESIEFHNASVGYAVFGQGTWFPNLIYKTTNGGENWSRVVDLGEGPAINEVEFVTPEIGYGAGLNGATQRLVIYKSTDGGANWRSQLEVGGMISFYQVSFVNQTTGYASGDLGQVRRTTDGGQTWILDHSMGNQITVYTVDAIDENTAWVAGANVFGGQGAQVLKRTVQLLPKAVVSSSKLDFGKMASGSKELTVTISAGNAVGLTVDDVYIDDANAAAKGFALVEPTSGFPITLDQNGSATIKVSYTPPAGAEAKRVISSLVIETNDPIRQKVYVQLFGEKEGASQGQPVAAISVSSLAFGEVERNSTKKLSFTISAGSAAGLRVDSLWIEEIMGAPGSFSILKPVGAFPMTVSSGTPMTVEIAYNPTVGNDESAAQLVITTNDPANEEVYVALTATSSEPSASIAGDAVASAGLALRADPNPLGVAGRISLQIASRSSLRVTLVDLLGNTVATLHDGTADAGSLSLPIDAAGLAEGIYYCVAETPNGRTVLPLTVTR